MKISLDFNIDMLLDAHLKLQIVSEDEMYKPIHLWCYPNLNRRDNEDWHRFYPIAAETPLHFEVDIRDELFDNVPLFIDLNLSTLELGYSGSRDSWVGPGRLFNYTLSQYIPSDDGRFAINRKT